jgi:hypothetical protein
MGEPHRLAAIDALAAIHRDLRETRDRTVAVAAADDMAATATSSRAETSR